MEINAHPKGEEKTSKRSRVAVGYLWKTTRAILLTL